MQLTLSLSLSFWPFYPFHLSLLNTLHFCWCYFFCFANSDVRSFTHTTLSFCLFRRVNSEYVFTFMLPLCWSSQIILPLASWWRGKAESTKIHSRWWWWAWWWWRNGDWGARLICLHAGLTEKVLPPNGTWCTCCCDTSTDANWPTVPDWWPLSEDALALRRWPMLL